MKVKNSLLIATTFFLLFNGCSGLRTAQPPIVSQPSVSKPEAKRTLMDASFYGKELAGRKTASGEIFQPNQLTAAHKTLPFGTVLRITSPETNKTVDVRVNDRGPFVKGRELDISHGAALALGIRDAGVAKVYVEVLQRTQRATN